MLCLCLHTFVYYFKIFESLILCMCRIRYKGKVILHFYCLQVHLLVISLAYGNFFMRPVKRDNNNILALLFLKLFGYPNVHASLPANNIL